jgi:hypothetical protein
MQNETTSDIQKLGMIVRIDVHGNNFLMAEGLDDAAVRDRLDALLARAKWLHHQTYSLYDYTPTSRKQLVNELRLIL